MKAVNPPGNKPPLPDRPKPDIPTRPNAPPKPSRLENKPERPPLPTAKPRKLGPKPQAEEAPQSVSKSPSQESLSIQEKMKIFGKQSEDAPPTKPSPTAANKPFYSQVDMEKKRAGKIASESNGGGESSKVVTQSSPAKKGPIVLTGDRKHAYDGVVILDYEPNQDKDKDKQSSAVAPTPPKKPPRTFAHDDYLKVKADRREARRKESPRRSPRTSASSGTLEHLYEEIEPEAESVSDNSTNVRTPAEKTKRKYDTIRPGGKLPPPPRPDRPPSIESPPSEDTHKDKPFVQINKHNDKLGQDYFLLKKKITNPAYEPTEVEIIPIRMGLKRSKSDESLSVETDYKKGIPDDPIYQDPVDVLRPRTMMYAEHSVTIDSEGYAVPGSHTLSRQQSIPPRKHDTLHYGGRAAQRKQQKDQNVKVRDRLNSAYSILRKQHRPDATDSPAKIPEDDEDDSDTDIDEKLHKRKMEHVTRVKSKTSGQVQMYGKMLSQVYRQLFDYALIVGLEKNEDDMKYSPKVLFNFPDKTGEDLSTISAFCFPDAFVWRPVTKCHSEMFSFVLTKADGARQYGYCRRVLPLGSSNRLPEVYCVVSSLNVLSLYDKLLASAESRRKISREAVEDLFKASYAKPLPPPGKEAWVRCPGRDDKMETLIFKRPMDVKANNMKYAVLLKHLPVPILLKVFSSVLLERRIIFYAQHLSTLSSCIHAIHTLLYPFMWQHTFVPVLPGVMIDVVCAPTPYILGVLSSLRRSLDQFELEEVLVVDLDGGVLMVQQGDEADIIPPKLQKALLSALKDDSDTESTRDVIVAEAFMRLFVETIGHYTEYICTQQDGHLVFQKEAFVKAVSSRSILLFLEWFTETQMFEVFITDKIFNRQSNTGLFEERVMEYREEMQIYSRSFTHNVKQVGRKMKNFLLESGDKIKKKFISDKVFV